MTAIEDEKAELKQEFPKVLRFKLLVDLMKRILKWLSGFKR